MGAAVVMVRASRGRGAARAGVFKRLDKAAIDRREGDYTAFGETPQSRRVRPRRGRRAVRPFPRTTAACKMPVTRARDGSLVVPHFHPTFSGPRSSSFRVWRD